MGALAGANDNSQWRYAQDILELGARPWHEIDVGAVEVAAERLVRRAARDKGLVERGMLSVP